MLWGCPSIIFVVIPDMRIQMMKTSMRVHRGFTLVGILLILVIISAVFYGMISYYQQKSMQNAIDRSALQMQQILNAALSYYVSNGYWPGMGVNDVGVVSALQCLYGSSSNPPDCQSQYLPSNLVNSPWGEPYNAQSNSSGSLFSVWVTISPASQAGQTFAQFQWIPFAVAYNLASTLPLGYMTSETSGNPPAPPAVALGSQPTDFCSWGQPCTVVSSINIPGQNLNNATAVNFAGLYHHGGCVPVPTCPFDANGFQTVPEIMVMPVSVPGQNFYGNNNVYPLTSFTAYAMPKGNPPPNCKSAPATPVSCAPLNGPPAPSGQYWRACMDVVTEMGDVGVTNKAPKNGVPWGANQVLLAITRCAVPAEPAGSPFTVYSQ